MLIRYLSAFILKWLILLLKITSVYALVANVSYFDDSECPKDEKLVQSVLEATPFTKIMHFLRIFTHFLMRHTM